jgi:hypothetical protein
VTRRQHLRKLVSDGHFQLSKERVLAHRHCGGVLVEAPEKRGCDAHRLTEWEGHARRCGWDGNADRGASGGGVQPSGPAGDVADRLSPVGREVNGHQNKDGEAG